jgi:hypothetical protein
LTSNANTIAHLLFLIFEDSKQLNAAQGTKVPTLRPIQGCALHHHSYRENPQGGPIVRGSRRYLAGALSIPKMMQRGSRTQNTEKGTIEWPKQPQKR